MMMVCSTIKKVLFSVICRQVHQYLYGMAWTGLWCQARSGLLSSLMHEICVCIVSIGLNNVATLPIILGERDYPLLPLAYEGFCWILEQKKIIMSRAEWGREA